MAVGVDYSLFYMRREREERAAGRDEQAALEAAAATSGRSVLVSGLTVMAAMAGHVPGRQQDVRLDGDGHDHGRRGRRPRLADGVAGAAVKARRPGDEGPRAVRRAPPGERGEPRLWSAVVDRVLRRPLASVLVSGGLVVALAIPAFGLHTSLPGLQGLPVGLADRQDAQPDRDRVSGRAAAGLRGHPGRQRDKPAGADGDPQPRTEGAGHRADPSAVQGAGQRPPRRRGGIDAAQRQGHGRASYRALDTLRNE